MNYKQGISREQLVFFTNSLDNSINTDSYIRIIDKYIESLKLAELGFRLPELKDGQPPYRFQILLKIYLYGYLEKIRSSRKLERECLRNNELIWLAEGLTPDFKTIANFRKNNPVALKNIFTNFLLFCGQQNLLSFETTAVDSTIIRAQNSKNSSYKKENLPRIKENIEKKIKEYMDQLDEEDKKEKTEIKTSGPEVAKTIERLDNLKKLKQKITNVEKIFEDNPDLEMYYTTDTDCRIQSDKGKKNPGYNVQTAGDDKNKLLIAAEVTQKANDLELMSFMVGKIEEIKNELEIKKETNVIMDSGYFSEKEIMASVEKENINIIVSDPKEAKKANAERTGKKGSLKPPTEEYELAKFKYDVEKDVYICPEGQLLHKTTTNPCKERNGKLSHEYQCRSCKGCAKKSYCTNNKNGRAIKRSINNEFMNNFKADMKTKENLKLIAKRKEIIEHPFGTLKRTLGYTSFMQRGLEKVQGEFSLMCFAYNFKRVMNILGAETMMAAIK
jgi:transposase